MAETENTKRQQELEHIRKEARRRSLDQLKLYNPLDAPFQTIWEGYVYVVQPKSENTFLRYIAEKWIREIVDHMITEDEKEAVDAENNKRRKKGWTPMNPQEHENFDMVNKLRTDDKERRMNYMKIVYKGVTRAHGMDVPEAKPVKRDTRPQDQKILEELDKVMGIAETLPDTGYEETEDKKDDLLKEISA